MNNEELKEILEKHAKYLNGDPDGERADLCGVILHGADLGGATLGGATLGDVTLGYVNLYGANLHGANLYGADLGGANIDFSCLPLWCGSLHVHFDNRQMIQILYHLLSVVSYSKYTSEEMRKALLTPELCEIANKFHRVDECSKISPADFSKEEI